MPAGVAPFATVAVAALPASLPEAAAPNRGGVVQQLAALAAFVFLTFGFGAAWEAAVSAVRTASGDGRSFAADAVEWQPETAPAMAVPATTSSAICGRKWWNIGSVEWLRD
jgi:hypothetical protein